MINEARVANKLHRETQNKRIGGGIKCLLRVMMNNKLSTATTKVPRPPSLATIEYTVQLVIAITALRERRAASNPQLYNLLQLPESAITEISFSIMV